MAVRYFVRIRVRLRVITRRVGRIMVVAVMVIYVVLDGCWLRPTLCLRNNGEVPKRGLRKKRVISLMA